MSSKLPLVLCALKRKLRKLKDQESIKSVKKKIRKIAALYILTAHSRNRRLRGRRRIWTRPIFEVNNRYLQGASDNLIESLREKDGAKYFNYLRMSPALFNELMKKIGNKIKKQDTILRKSIPARTRLQLTLRYLATGDSMTSISYIFRVGISTVSKIIFETCDAIWNTLKDDVLKLPNQVEWRNIADNFEKTWNFPNCVGAIDGKHVVIQAPSNSGSTFYNYKGSHSVNLLAVVDASRCFIMVDVGASGRQSDGGVFRNSNIGQAINCNLINLPTPREVNGIILPYVFVGDEAFSLTKYMMRPYPRSSQLNRRKKVFNYRLSRARRIVETAFGILASKWRIFRKPIIASLETVNKIILATVCLHNFIIKRGSEHFRLRYTSLEEREVDQPTGLINLGRMGSNTYARPAAQTREEFAEYFENQGAVDWQWDKVLQNDF